MEKPTDRRPSEHRSQKQTRGRRSLAGKFDILAEAIRRNAVGDDEDEKRHRRFNTGLAGAIVLFTFAQVLVSGLQWASMESALQVTRKSNKLTRESNEISRRALEASQRSWLIATEIEPREITSRDTDIEVRVQNLGSSPAFNVRVETFLRFYPLNEKFVENVELPKPVGVASQAVVAQQQAIVSFGSLREFSELRIGLVKTGDHILELRGTVTYSDRLLGERHTRYCRVWKRGPEGKPGRWLFCPGFNDAD